VPYSHSDACEEAKFVEMVSFYSVWNNCLLVPSVKQSAAGSSQPDPPSVKVC